MSKRFVITLSDGDYRSLQARAQAEDRPVAALARKIIRDALKGSPGLPKHFGHDGPTPKVPYDAKHIRKQNRGHR